MSLPKTSHVPQGMTTRYISRTKVDLKTTRGKELEKDVRLFFKPNLDSGIM